MNYSEYQDKTNMSVKDQTLNRLCFNHEQIMRHVKAFPTQETPCGHSASIFSLYLFVAVLHF